MEFLKDVLGDGLFNHVSEKLKGHEKDIKIANLASGDYVSKAKYDADLQARDTRITELADQVQLAVAKSGARSEKALMGMLDLDKLTLDDNRDVKGLDEQIEAIKKDSAFLLTPDPPPPNDIDFGGGQGHEQYLKSA